MELTLRDAAEGDLPTFFAHQSDPQAYRMAAFTPRDEEAFFAHWRKVLADPAIEKKTILWDGRVVGNLCCFERGGKREVGYWIGREFWGRGIASEALRRFLGEYAERPLYAFAAKSNRASLRVLEKCGFVIVGEQRGSPDGRNPDVEDYLLELRDTGKEPDHRAREGD